MGRRAAVEGAPAARATLVNFLVLGLEWVQESIDMTRQQVLDLYFLEARSKLIDLAAFLDRVDRAQGEADFRLKGLRHAIRELEAEAPQRAQRVLLALSDPTVQPIPQATTKAACGAWPSAT